jgi:transposase-like protein
MEPGILNGAEEAGNRNAPYIEKGGRRQYKEWFKAQVAQACLAPDAMISVVARRYNINTNVLFRWRRELRQGLLRPARTESFVSAGVIGPDSKVQTPKSARPSGGYGNGTESKKEAIDRRQISAGSCPVGTACTGWRRGAIS